MGKKTTSPALSSNQVVEMYFLEHRAKLIDIAAFLDRVERAAAVHGATDDFRLRSFKQALALLSDGTANRTARILKLLSDPTSEPLESAAGLKGAYGAYPAARQA